MDKQALLKSISDYIKTSIREDVRIGFEKPVSHYLDSAKREIRSRHAFSKHSGLLKRKTYSEFEKCFEEISEELVDIINGYIHEYKNKNMTKEIKATTAQAVIKAAMQEAGLKHHFIAQTYRAKVLYPICPNRYLAFYITYSRLHEQLPQVIESLKKIEEGMNGLGKNPTINRSYNINWI